MADGVALDPSQNLMVEHPAIV